MVFLPANTARHHMYSDLTALTRKARYMALRHSVTVWRANGQDFNHPNVVAAREAHRATVKADDAVHALAPAPVDVIRAKMAIKRAELENLHADYNSAMRAYR